MARILIVTPAARSSRKGNRVTACRWAGLLRNSGHRVSVAEEFTGQRCDVLIAFHARRSAPSVAQCHRESPEVPIILLLTGTDLYGDIHHDRSAVKSLDLADRLVLLQSHGIRELPQRLHHKVRVVVQSAVPPSQIPRRLKRTFEVCLSGHLRAVKDPFRTAMAVRRLPAPSKIRVSHIGSALTPAMEQRALNEMARNTRYRWLGEVPGWKARRLVARSRLLVLSSRLEGGANVISEAVVAGVPVLASRISGSIGLLGEDYPGYFDVGSTSGLASLLIRCEQDDDFYHSLRMSIQNLVCQFTPSREQSALDELVEEVCETGRDRV